VISILLASYNGEAFIAEQIESLLAQTVRDFRLYISDDKSTDATFSIICEYAAAYPGKIFISQNESNSGGAKHNFISMMVGHKDDYVMLCDQDDVWLPDKIEVTLARMKETEACFGAATPILVHTDLRVVDKRLRTVYPSYRVAMHADYSRTRLNNLLVQNTLTGCTAMYNRALADLITVPPPYTVMHDWWLMLVASVFGKIEAIDDAQTILYRQHGGNEIGAKDVRSMRYKMNRMLNYNDVKRALDETYRQAAGLLSVFGDALPSGAAKLIAEYCDIPNHRFKPYRWLKICRLGVLKYGFTRKIANFLFV
jgi:glycosyltransferase involved in cell wall biosynthesis